MRLCDLGDGDGSERAQHRQQGGSEIMQLELYAKTKLQVGFSCFTCFLCFIAYQ